MRLNDIILECAYQINGNLKRKLIANTTRFVLEYMIEGKKAINRYLRAGVYTDKGERDER